jgi:hypothetical protein
MTRTTILTILLLLAGVGKSLVSVSVALYLLAVGEGGPLAFLMPYAEVILLLPILGRFVFGHKPSDFERALRQEVTHPDNDRSQYQPQTHISGCLPLSQARTEK